MTGGGPTRWGSQDGGAYAARFDALEAEGVHVHGEADLVSALAPAPSRVLDAGCGTGRVAVRLAATGHDVTGVDLDAGMLAVARDRAPQIAWHTADLATLDLGEHFDVVLCAGNVVPLAAPGTEPAVVARMAAHLRPGGLLVAGFGLDRAHLPDAATVLDLADYDGWCSDAGLSLVERWGTWERGAPDAGYAVSVHRRD